MRRAAVLAVALALVGCPAREPAPAAEDATSVLATAAASLGQIRSGELGLAIELARAEDETPLMGFVLQGAFALAAAGSLPVADVEYRQVAGGNEASAHLLSTGERAFVVVDDVAYELPSSATETLRGVGSSGSLGELRIDEWLSELSLDEGGQVGGTDTNHVTGTLDAAQALTDLLALAAGAGATPLPAATASPPTADELRRIIEAASIDVYAGKTDGLLRRVAIEVTFGAQLPPDLEQAFDSLSGATFSFELNVTDPNREVEVAPPTDVRPFEDLPTSPPVG